MSSTSASANLFARPVSAMAARLVLAALACVVAGCAQETAYETMSIVSGSPDRDAAAFAASERHLTEVRWDVIQKKGPKPIWDRLGTKADEEAGKGGGKLGGVTSGRRGRRRMEDDKVIDATAEPQPQREIVFMPPPPATTQPTTQPSTQPTTQPVVASAAGTAKLLAPFVMRPSYVEDELPVKIVELPDRRIRIIWALQNYGGSSVKSTRDVNTSRRAVEVAPPDLAPLVNVLQQQLGTLGQIHPLPRENTIVVTCDPAMKAPMLEMLYRLDVPPRQVEISAKIFEVSRDFDFQQGAKALAQRISSDNSQTAQSLFQTPNFLEAMNAGNPFQGGILTFMKVCEEMGISIDVQIQVLADAGMIKLVSSPRMTVAAGQTGYMLAGQELPVQSSSIVNGAITISTQYKPVGVQLYITPQAIGPDRVKLHTISIVSSVSGFAPLPKINGQNPDKVLVNPIIESREAETAVTVVDGDTLVISGLRMSRTTTRENKIPGLGDIPLLGWLFKNHRSQQQLTDLYFFVTPSLL
jgi:type II secretory pathway component GspD/PulD (secretin)